MNARSRLDKNTIPVTECGCTIWLGQADGGGYGVMKVGGKAIKTHRLAWTLERGAIPLGMNVLHRCDVRCCVNVDHLFIGTQADNVADMMSKGRQKTLSGERNGRAKLTLREVAEIRQSQRTCHQLAAEYGVGKSMISYIKRGESWRPA